MSRKRFLISAVILLALHGSFVLGAFEVVEDELFFEDPPIIEFENFSGIPDRIDTAEEIRAIGQFLGQAREREEQRRIYAGRYQVIRAVDPEDPDGLDADIILLLPDSRVDHIDNIRRIIAGYLAETYGYSSGDAALLARFTTIYNAVHRRDMAFYREIYKSVVLEYLEPERVGLPLSYREWSGNTQIVIPIRDPDAQERLGTISPRELIDDQVIQDLRARRDMGLEDRRDMIDFLERLIEEEEQEIEEERERIEQEREEIEAERERREPDDETEEPEVAAEPDDEVERDDPAVEATDEPEEITEEPDLDVRGQELDERDEELDQREEDTEELREEVDRLREDAADDQEETLQAEEPDEETPAAAEPDLVTLLLITRSSFPLQSQLVRVDPASGRIAARSTSDTILGRRYLSSAEGIVALTAVDGAAELTLFAADSLSVQQRGETRLHEGSALETAPGGGIYAIIQDGGSTYVGLFNPDLVEITRSTQAVQPYTPIVRISGKVYVQAPDNSFRILDPETLERSE